MNKERARGQRKGLPSRLLAMLLSVALVVGMVPITSRAADTTVDTRVVDDYTINDWKNLYKEDTSFDAGAVWTDKSVFTDELPEEFDDVVNVNNEGIQMIDPDENFIVALSAMASNKEIVGYSTTPTDTILILDVSGSMDNSGSIPQTVSAANSAINRLLELNRNNRVGVVLYSGNENFGVAGTNTGKLLLGLNRYVKNSSGNYLTYTTSNDSIYVNIAQGVRVEGNSNAISTRNTAKEVVGGTYIQNGIDIAMDEFLKAEPTIESDNVQGGETRMPIFVLMSDGAPTSGTASYTNIGSSTMGNGGATSAGLGFVTQLTAAYALNQVETHYNEDVEVEEEKVDAKFYTLGLNLSAADSDGQYVANSVLNPSASLDAIDTYWENLFRANGTGTVRFQTPGTSNRENNQNIWATVTRNQNDGLTLASQNYVDEYFEASTNADLNAAFTDIVNEIIIQSAYYPTMVDSGNHDLDGYITFEDELGQFMEVKHITGLMLGDNYLYTGEALAKMMGTDQFGDRYTYTELGWELVGTVAERIGVSQDVAIEILKSAWADGQLSYNETTGEYSNYIGWYEGADGSYKGYWNDKHTVADIPADATYISQSYGFYGTERDNSIEALKSDMMHVVVKVRTEIATGHQDVVFQIPASLVPVITYHVELDADNFEDAENITMKLEENVRPIRLLFEVGLRDDINELNVAEITNASGEYYFYTNQWESGVGDPSTVLNEQSADELTISHFHPSKENERYYYTDDIVIYEEVGNNQYNVYTGTTKPTGSNYYHRKMVFKHDMSTADAYDVDITNMMHYEPIKPETLDVYAKPMDDGTGRWQITEGPIYQLIGNEYNLYKAVGANKTETLEFVDIPKVIGLGEGENIDTYDIYDFLGNNGRLSLTPATGIKLTKQVDETITVDNEYKFTVEVGGVGNNTYTFYAADGTKGTITFANGVAEVTLKANETVYITGLPDGAAYTVSEVPHVDYKVSSVTIDGLAVADTKATGSITAYELEDIGFTNTARGKGSLVISKTVTHDLGSDYVIPSNQFEITVKLTDVLGSIFAEGTVVSTSAGDKKVDAEGKISLKLAHDQSVTINNLTAGTEYTVEEVLPEGSGFTLTGVDLTRTGEIEADQTKNVDLENEYNPIVPTIGIDVTKSVQYENGTAITNWDSDYHFVLEMLEGNNWVHVNDGNTLIEGTASESDPVFRMTIPKEYLDMIGTYYFRVRETNAGAGIVSDTTRYFTVNVSDTDMDGKIEVAVTAVQNGGANGQEIDIAFVNEYLVEGNVAVEIPIHKDLINTTGVEIPRNSFSFVLKDSTGKEVGKYNTDANGDAVIHLTYDSDNLMTGTDTYVYTLAEENQGKTGMEYSSELYTITVKLESNGGTLSLVNGYPTIVGSTVGEKETAVFENKFNLNPAPLIISGTKNLTGRNIVADEFEFGLYKTDSDFVIDSQAILVDSGKNTVETVNSGKFILEGSVETAGIHYYVVKEISSSAKVGVAYDNTLYHITAIVADGGNGKLEVTGMHIAKAGSMATTGDEIVFNNVYTPEPISVVIAGKKELTGAELVSGMFEFTLTGEGVNETVANSDRDGNFTFSEIKYTKAGTYEYEVRETIPNPVPKGYTYDDSYFKVTVEITDNTSTGKLEKSVKYTEIDGADVDNVDHTIIFRNGYDAKDATIELTAQKFLENRELQDKEFTFAVFEADEDFNIVGTTAVSTATNGAYDAKNVYDRNLIQFDSFDISETGTHYYVIKEMKGLDANVTYDSTEYQVTILVFDMGGELGKHMEYAIDGVPINTVLFSNVYTPPVVKDVFKQNTNISIDGKVVTAGDVLTYEITYTNKSTTATADVVIEDTIPEGTSYVAGSASHGAVYSNGKLTWELEGVGIGTSVTVSFAVEVEAVDENIQNTAYVIEGGNRHESNTVYNHTYHKVVDKKTAKLGEELAYTINYENHNDVEAEVIIVDKLDAGLTYVEGSATKGGVYDANSHTITWTFRAEIDEASEVSFKAVINENAVEIIDNVATVQVGNEAEVSTNTVKTVLTNPDVTIEKTQAVNVKTGEAVDGTKELLEVEAEDVVTYYLTVKNSKGAGTAEDVEIMDILPEGLKLHSIQDGGVIDATGNISWPTIDKLVAGESVTVSFKVVVPKVEKETLWTNVASALYEDPSDENDEKIPVESNEVDIVERVDGLTISKAQKVNDGTVTTEKQKVSEGDKVTYIITVSNAEGASEAENVVVTDNIPAGLIIEEETISHKGTLKAGAITWNLGTMKAGESITLSFQVRIPDVDKATEWKNIAIVTYNEDGEKPSEEVVVEDAAPNVSVAKFQRVNPLGSASADKQKVKAGDKVVYSIIATNSGSVAAKGVTIVDKIPTGLKLVEGSISTGGKVVNGVITWTIDELAAGTSVEVHFKVEVPEVEEVGEWSNIATMTYENDETGSKEPYSTNEVVVTMIVAPKTGDEAPTTMWTSLAFASLMVCAVLLINEKRRNREA